MSLLLLEVHQAARRGFCASGTALSFSVMRSPWERVLSSYLEKVRVRARLGLGLVCSLCYVEKVTATQQLGLTRHPYRHPRHPYYSFSTTLTLTPTPALTRWRRRKRAKPGRTKKEGW